MQTPATRTREAGATQIQSSLFGAFDPTEPRNIEGRFSGIVAIVPLQIHAPARAVWDVVVDFERYPEWNPLNRFFRCDGERAPGQRVTFGYTFARSKGSDPLPAHDHTISEVITVWDEGACFSYADVKPGFANERTQYVRADSADTSTYFTFERFSGPVSPLIRLLFGARIRDSFQRTALALKARAESLHR
jgi:hypothetical protein